MTNPTELLRLRYGVSDFNLDIDWNDCLTTLLSHRSIRAYLPNSLPVGTLELIVAAAQSAATSSNLQTWSVVAVEEAERKERLSKLAGNVPQRTNSFQRSEFSGIENFPSVFVIIVIEA